MSPLLFVSYMIPLTLLQRKEISIYEFKGKLQRINHLLFMGDDKLYGNEKDQISFLVNLFHCSSMDFKMEFSLAKVNEEQSQRNFKYSITIMRNDI